MLCVGVGVCRSPNTRHEWERIAPPSRDSMKWLKMRRGSHVCEAVTVVLLSVSFGFDSFCGCRAVGRIRLKSVAKNTSDCASSTEESSQLKRTCLSHSFQVNDATGCYLRFKRRKIGRVNVDWEKNPFRWYKIYWINMLSNYSVYLRRVMHGRWLMEYTTEKLAC